MLGLSCFYLLSLVVSSEMFQGGGDGVAVEWRLVFAVGVEYEEVIRFRSSGDDGYYGRKTRAASNHGRGVPGYDPNLLDLDTLPEEVVVKR